MEVKDLVGLSAPLTKLIETVSDGIGTLYEPRRVRARASAEADASVIQAKAEVAVLEVHGRAQNRVLAREIRRQRNLEQIVDNAARQLPASVSSVPVDEDWFAEFLNCAQDVSNETMQSLWGKILAGEVAKPSSFSRRTLAVVSLLDQNEAEMFTKFCSLFWRTEGRYVLFLGDRDNEDDLFKSAGLTSGQVVHLEQIGLAAQAPAVMIMRITFEEGKAEVWHYFGKQFEVRASEHYGPVTKDVIPLTVVGEELAPICGAQPRPEYLAHVLEEMRNARLTVREIV